MWNKAEQVKARQSVENMVDRVMGSIEKFSTNHEQAQEWLGYLEVLLAHTGNTRAASRVHSAASSTRNSTAGSRESDKEIYTEQEIQEREEHTRQALSSLDNWGKANCATTFPRESRSKSSNSRMKTNSAAAAGVTNEPASVHSAPNEASDQFDSYAEMTCHPKKAQSKFQFDGKAGEKLFGMQVLTEADISGSNAKEDAPTLDEYYYGGVTPPGSTGSAGKLRRLRSPKDLEMDEEDLVATIAFAQSVAHAQHTGSAKEVALQQF